VWLDPEAEDNALKRLQAELEKEFPFCCEQSGKDYGGYSPHLTVGQFVTKKEVLCHIESWGREWEPMEWKVGRVFLISRYPSPQSPLGLSGIQNMAPHFGCK
jgi:2'-5' RNA ligase